LVINGTHFLCVAEADAGLRLDTWLTREVRVLARAHIRRLIHAGRVRLNGRPVIGRCYLQAGEQIEIEVPPPLPPALQAQAIFLEILHEDADIIVINKPPGLVMHPACGHAAGTLANALIHHCPDMIIGNEIRPGLVHRLDRDTSGVLVAAKNARALAILARQFKRRDVRKEYLALVWGRPDPPTGTIAAPIGPDPADPRKMAAAAAAGRPATTHYLTEQALGAWTLLRLRLETGRTHQIRVHLAHIGHPVVGDRMYGDGPRQPCPASVSRQLLHAGWIRIRHPATNAYREFSAPWPDDMRAFIGVIAGSVAETCRQKDACLS
jgi:23S rRNA pseudouridine1911/1915/1917 synthase